MVWFIMAGMAALAALAAIWPLLRSPVAFVKKDAAQSEAAFYTAQLVEIQRDVARGLLPQSEAANARAEAARRLLSVGSTKPKGDATWVPRPFVALIVALSVPLIAFSLYIQLGQPRMADEPLADRPGAVAEKDVGAAVAGVEAHLLAKPDDGKGWAVLAPVYMRLDRYDDAAHAYSEALRLLGEDPSLRAAYGEALVAAASGVVTDKARAAFEKAAAEDASLPQARFYLALAAEQDGRGSEAIRAYESLLSAAPMDAPWLGVVRARLAALKGGSSSTTAGSVVAALPDQKAMIEGMVNRLATRLADQGGDVEEWGRLIRAYAVLQKGDKAKAALAGARKALAHDAASVARLDRLAQELGLGEAN
jgi:cytochrome c-type biogenesis protein CcmH